MSWFGGFSTAGGECTFLLRTTEEEKLPKEEGVITKSKLGQNAIEN
jgi:hypothetical protein